MILPSLSYQSSSKVVQNSRRNQKNTKWYKRPVVKHHIEDIRQNPTENRRDVSRKGMKNRREKNTMLPNKAQGMFNATRSKVIK